jgi:hypothetical protein
MRALLAVPLLLAVLGLHTPPPTGDQLLARVTAAPGVKSYTVPVSFAMRLHKPIGIRAHVAGTAYFVAPGQAALAITHAPGLIGGFFKGNYKLDVVPQAWPAHYRVLDVQPQTSATGARQLVLDAMPRGNPGDVAHVTFVVDQSTHAAVGATWTYQDGSTIVLTFVNAPVGAIELPSAATIHVDMPKYKLDANATYGTYALNAPVDPGVFTATH